MNRREIVLERWESGHVVPSIWIGSSSTKGGHNGEKVDLTDKDTSVGVSYTLFSYSFMCHNDMLFLAQK
jgi:hypothetical protein